MVRQVSAMALLEGLPDLCHVAGGRIDTSSFHQKHAFRAPVALVVSISAAVLEDWRFVSLAVP